MKNDKILLELKKYLKEKDGMILKNLIEKLEQDIRETSAYKGGNRTKIATIKRITKVKDKPVLNGYSVLDNGNIVFTDSYRAFEINKIDMSIKEVIKEYDLNKEMSKDNYIIGNYPNITNIMSSYDIYKGDNVELDIQDIMYQFKIRDTKNKDKNIYIIKLKDYEIAVDVQYLKEMFDILGTDLIVRANGELKPLYMENKQGEKGILMPIRL